MNQDFGKIISMVGVAIVLSIVLYYYFGGVALIREFGTAVPKLVSGIENFQPGYPAA